LHTEYTKKQPWKGKMAVLRRRTRIVSFRISEEEYEDLMDLCAIRQARSLSDFARVATLGQSQANAPSNHAEGMLSDVYRQLRLLDREVKRLAALVEPGRLDTYLALRPMEASQA
jgi:uncharacterized protein YerC